MTSASDYRFMQEAHKRARRAGFQLCILESSFGLVPIMGAANRLMSLPWSAKYQTLEEAMAFCDGWYQLERTLQRRAGIGVKEISDRMEQHRVLLALKGKGRRKKDDGI